MMSVYSIKDCKSQTFSGLYPIANDALAIRAFSSEDIKNNYRMIKEFPGDFQLFRIGTFDDVTGVLVSDVKHVADFNDLFGVSQHGN